MDALLLVIFFISWYQGCNQKKRKRKQKEIVKQIIVSVTIKPRQINKLSQSTTIAPKQNMPAFFFFHLRKKIQVKQKSTNKNTSTNSHSISQTFSLSTYATTYCIHLSMHHRNETQDATPRHATIQVTHGETWVTPPKW